MATFTVEYEDVLLHRLQSISKLLDAAYRIPGTNFRIGVDPIIGLIPVVGDLFTIGMSAYTLTMAHKLGAPRWLLLRMLLNVAIDALIGAIPIIGDLFDFAFKAHMRNLKLLERWLAVRR